MSEERNAKTTFAASKGVFTTRTDVALQSIDGLGFSPHAVVAWWSHQATHQSERGNSGGIGFWTIDLTASIAWTSSDAKTSSETQSLADTAAIVGFVDAGDVVDMRAELVSFDRDGMSLRWTVRPSKPWMVHFLAIGGESPFTTRVGCVSAPPSAHRTDLGLTTMHPDLLLVMATSAERGLLAEGVEIGIGAAGRRGQAAAGYSSPHGARPGRVTGAQRSDTLVVLPSSPGDAPTTGALGRRRAGSLAVEWSRGGREARRLCFLAVEGLRARVGMDVSTAAPGSRRTEVGFRPEALLLFSWGLGASSHTKDIGRLCVGGASEQAAGCASWDDRNVEAHETSTHVASSTAHVLVITDTQTGGIHARAALQSIDDSGFTLEWTESDGKLRQFAYVALGPRGDGGRVTRAVNRIFRRARSSRRS